MIQSFDFHVLAALEFGPIEFAKPMLLVLLAVCVPLTIFLARKSLAGLGKSSRVAALVVRVIALVLVISALARPSYRDEATGVSVMVINDVSRSIPSSVQPRVDSFVDLAQNGSRLPDDKLGVITAARFPIVQSAPSKFVRGIERQFIGDTESTNLASAVNQAIANKPADSAARIVLFTDANETEGSLFQAAQQAKAAGIPIDVLPIDFEYSEEIMVEAVQAPSNTRVGETIAIKVVLTSTTPAVGRLMLSRGGTPIDLDPAADQLGYYTELKVGRNVIRVPVSVNEPGPQLYDAVFEPIASLNSDGTTGTTIGDSLRENNNGSVITFVGSEGTVLIVVNDPREAVQMEDALHAAEIQTKRITAAEFPGSLPELASYEAVVLINQSAYSFAETQQEMMRQYVNDTGGGIVMIGGPESFGAGGWIGSPLADALPIRLDPPQKRQMPRGALALIVHSVEIPRGVFYGKQISNAAVDALSRLDLIGIVEYQGLGGTDWVYPMSPVGDRSAVRRAINDLQFGDMPSFDPSLQLALTGLQNAQAGQKHCIVISDGDPSLSRNLLRQFKQSGITISAVGVNPHSAGDTNTLRTMARMTGGTYYNVGNNALATLPQIFIKEAQTIRRALIWEGEAFSPARTGVPTETMRGISGVPPIQGYVVAAEREGLSLVTLRGKEEDPIAAQWQYGLGKVVTFTSDVSTKWAPSWVGWSGFNQFWEQHVRWAMRPGGDSTLRVSTENTGERTRVIVEAFDPAGERMDFANFRARASTPDGLGEGIELRQVGPGRYEGDFDTSKPGSYVVNMQYRAAGGEPGTVYEGSAQAAVIRPFADEYKSLKTNLPLLRQVASITGGRVLNADPALADLWSRDGLTMPVALTPIWMALAIAGIVIFLMDVAVRRVRINPRAIAGFVRRGAHKEGAQSMGATAAMRTARTRASSRVGDDRGDGESAGKVSARKFEADESIPVSSDPVALSGQEESDGSSIAKPKKESTTDETIDALSALRAAKKRARDDYEGHE
ncbi:MAG: glutamine amidotransferase [Phycisphaerales bacterium]